MSTFDKESQQIATEKKNYKSRIKGGLDQIYGDLLLLVAP